jgi:2-polyprenyl-3-methyl-5-hydroxy-6-metoxy-1,4-benzoquinol methylase
MSIVSHANNLSEYLNPTWYDAENRWGPDDDFYLALAKRIGGPVLDVACGTGRLTRALAENGLTVTGVDLMPPMLDHARALAGDLPISWQQADCRTMQLGQRFRLALMTSHAFQHLLTNADQDAFLATLYAHLEPGGRLAFETRNPGDSDWHDTDWARWRTFTDPAGQTVEVWMRSIYDQPNLLEHIELRRMIQATGATVESQITLRYTAVEELNLRLAAHGFTVVEQYGNWMPHPLIYDSPEIITVCQRSH